MKGFELQFEDNEYYLVDGKTNDTIATTDKVLLKEHDGYMKKLSIKNCEAIERGYDLDELANESANQFMDGKDHFYGFKVGFQKALEILSDKKFSEEDMLSFESFVSKWYDKAKDIEEFTALPSELLVKWKSLQQTEWDVEIVQELIQSSIEGEAIWKLKLDVDGCLILRRI